MAAAKTTPVTPNLRYMGQAPHVPRLGVALTWSGAQPSEYSHELSGSHVVAQVGWNLDPRRTEGRTARLWAERLAHQRWHAFRKDIWDYQISNCRSCKAEAEGAGSHWPTIVHPLFTGIGLGRAAVGHVVGYRHVGRFHARRSAADHRQHCYRQGQKSYQDCAKNRHAL